MFNYAIRVWLNHWVTVEEVLRKQGVHSVLELAEWHHLTNCDILEVVIESVGSIFSQFIYQLDEVILFKDIQYLV